MTTALTLLGLLAVLLPLALLWRRAARHRHDYRLLRHRSFYTTWDQNKNPGPRDRIPDELRDDYRKGRGYR